MARRGQHACLIGKSCDEAIIDRRSQGKVLANVLPLLGNLYGKFMEKIGSKAPENHAASVWSYNCLICLRENTKTISSMISGLLNVSTSPNTNYVYLWSPRIPQQNKNKDPHNFKKDYVYKSQIWEIVNFKTLDNSGTDK